MADAALRLWQAARLAERSRDAGSLRRAVLVRRLIKAHGLTRQLRSADGDDASSKSSEVSVVTACRNRNENLVRAIPTWLACKDVGEVVIVDWTSDVSVQDSLDEYGIDDERVQVYRVEAEPRWILSLAFNLGFQKARLPFILKADADITIEPDFFDRNPPPSDGFVAGNWRNAGPDQVFVNGFFYIERADLLSSGGFNEFITSYGWDDEELYARLVARGLSRLDVAPGSIHHLDHDDSARINMIAPEGTLTARAMLASEPKFLIRRNRYIANTMPDWGEHRAQACYSSIEVAGASETLERRPSSAQHVPDAVIREADLTAARELMSWRISDNCAALPLDVVERLISNHSWGELTPSIIGAEFQSVVRTATPASSRPSLIVDAQHGLGNRLRAIASAAAVAEAEDREFVIVWRRDHHCDCRFSDLFNYEGEVLESDAAAESMRRGASLVNYMEVERGAHKDSPVHFDPDRNLYFRSAYVMNHAASTWDRENVFLRNLRPVSAVADLIDSVRSPNDVSLHVRMGSGPKFEHLPWEAPENWNAESHKLLAHWREKSHFDRFAARTDALIREGRAETVFLAADLPEVYESFASRFGSRACYLQRRVNDRSMQQLQYALADALLLGRSRLLLGSTWSSFTELALRMAPHDLQAEMSGTDF